MKEHDSDFNKFQIGDIVAYNRSGEVLLGEVVDVQPTYESFSWGKRKRCDAKIRNLEDNKVSKVNYEGSICNISEYILEITPKRRG